MVAEKNRERFSEEDRDSFFPGPAHLSPTLTPSALLKSGKSPSVCKYRAHPVHLLPTPTREDPKSGHFSDSLHFADSEIRAPTSEVSHSE